jgi:hypothetical protein
METPRKPTSTQTDAKHWRGAVHPSVHRDVIHMYRTAAVRGGGGRAGHKEEVSRRMQWHIVGTCGNAAHTSRS